MALADVIDLLGCPLDAEALALDAGALAPGGATLACARGHRFDVARQGYVNLLLGPAPAAADTAAMVAARAAFQAAGHQRALAGALAAATADVLRATHRARVADVGAGTGYHLAAVMEATGAQAGLALDLSKHAARRAARVHPRIGAVVCDVWAGLPVRDASLDAVLVAFAPRPVAELTRVLRPGGVLVVATPTPAHLAPLVDELGLLHVDPGKVDELDAALAGRAGLLARSTVDDELLLDHEAIGQVVAMGPSAHHLDPAAVSAATATLPPRVLVRASVTVSVYRCA